MPSVQEDGGLSEAERRRIIEEERLRFAVRTRQLVEVENRVGDWMFKSGLQLLGVFIAIGVILFFVSWCNERKTDRQLKAEPITAPSSAAPQR